MLLLNLHFILNRMTLTEILLFVAILLLIVNILVSIFKKNTANIESVRSEIIKTSLDLSKIDPLIRSEFSGNRDEIQKSARESRLELSASLKNFSDQLTLSITGLGSSQKAQLETFSNFLQTMIKNNEEKFEKIIASNEENKKELQELLSFSAKENRTELTGALKSFEERFAGNAKEFNELQRQKFNDLTIKQEQIKNDTENKLEKIRETVENKLKALQEDNSKKLEEMRNTVDEKLQTTLEKRFNDSFTLISQRLELVHKGLGEMQALASNVGDIKKVMNNVKSRGILGEYQLANILEDLLTNEQYGKNVKTKAGSGAIVEFAIKMPNNSNLEKTLWLPIDSKFPKEDYEALVDAYDDGDAERIEELKRSFKNAIIKNAKDIREKYIDPPNTTEYAIMFLPFESLYAEVLRTPGLFEQLQKEYKITITGPTTLSALLNSLQMGFRTLAIEKRSIEVWDLLGAVKTEFGKFGTVLEKTKRKLEEATKTIDDAGVRSRAIERQLRKVQELPADEAQKQMETVINNTGANTESRIEDILFDDDSNE